MDNTRFVDQLYTQFFGRDADPAGRAFWVHALEQSAVDAIKLTSIFLDSGEFSSRVQNVSSLYYTAFGRIPDSGGLAFWLHQSQSGMSLATISAAFTASAEYQQRYAGNSDAGFIDLLYVGALGHLPDAAARAQWLDQLAHGSTRAAVLQGMSQSADVIDHNSAAYKIIATYQGITGQSPTQTQVEGALALHDPLALIGSLYQGASYTGVALPGVASGAGQSGATNDPAHAPTLLGTFPLNAANGFVGNIALTFSEIVQAGAGNIILTDGASQSVVNSAGQLEMRIVGATDTRTIGASTSQVHYNGDVVSLVLDVPLLTGRHYSVLMAPGVIVDTDNLPYGGLADTTKFSFNATTTDLTPPTPLSISIANTHLHAGQTTLVTITFSEQISSLSSSNFSIDQGILSGFSTGDGGTTWTSTFTPSPGIEDNSNTVFLDGSGVHDKAGNAGTGTVASPNYIVDTILPVAAVTSIQVLDTGVSNSDFITSTANQLISGSYAGTLGLGEKIIVTIDGTQHEASVDIELHSWSYAAGTLGSSALSAYVVNSADNHSTVVSQALTIDTTAPTLSTTTPGSGASDVDVSGNIVFTFDASLAIVNQSGSLTVTPDVGSPFQVALSDSQVTVSGNTLTYNPNSDFASDSGYTVTLAAGDLGDVAGNPAPGASVHFTTPDLSAPAAPSVVLDAASDTGTSNSDRLTSDTTPSFHGSAEPFSHIDLYDTTSGATLVGSATALSDGSWSLTASSLAAGSRVFQATATDATSHTSALSSAYHVTIDPAGPTLNAIALSDNDLVNSDTSTVTFTFSEPLASFDGTNISVTNSGTLANFTLINSITWQATLTPAAATFDASNLFTVDMSGVQDPAGNHGTGNVDSPNYAVNTLAPTAVISTALISDDAGSSASDYITNITSQTISGAYTGTPGANETIEVLIDGVPQDASFSAGHYSLAVTGLSNASHTLDVRVHNSVSNQNTTAVSHTLVIDTVAPIVSSTAPANLSSEVAVNVAPTYHFSEPVAIKLPTDHLTLSNVTQSSSVNIALSDAQVSISGNDLVLTPSASLATDSLYQLALAAGDVMDVAGNVSAALTFSFRTPDTVTPDAPTVVLDAASDSGSSNSDQLTNDTTPSFHGTTEAFAHIDLYDTTSGSTMVGSTTALIDGSWGVTASTLGAGSRVFQATATDAAGHTSVLSGAYHLTIDPAGPTLNSIVLSDNDLATSETGTVTFNFSEPLASFDGTNIRFTDSATLSAFTQINSITWQATLTPAPNTTDANNVVDVDMSSVQDPAGNHGTGDVDSPNYAVNTQAPTAIISTALISDDSGSSASDYITNVTSQTISGNFIGTLGANESIQVLIDGTPQTATVDVAGHYTLAVTGLTNDPHTLDVRVHNSANNLNSASVSHTLVIDTSAPGAPTTAPPNSGVSFPTTNDIVYTYNEPVVLGNGAVLIDVNNTTDTNLIHVALSDSQVVVSGNTVTFNPATDLVSGKDYQFTLNAGGITDVAGNAAPGKVITFNTNPLLSPSSLNISSESNSGYPEDHLTNDTTPTIRGHAAAGATVKLFVDGGVNAVGTGTADLEGIWSITSTAIAEGSHLYTANTADVNGNLSGPSGGLTVTIDTTAPTLTSAPQATFERGTPATFTFSEDVYGNDGGTLIIDDSQGDQRSFDVTTLSMGNDSFDFNTSTLISGHSYTITFSAGALVDLAGNQAGQVQATVMALPVAPTTPDMPDRDDLGDDMHDNLTSKDKPTFEGTAEANTAVALYDNGGASPIATGVVDEFGHWSIPLTTGLDDGEHLITAKDVDGQSHHSAPSTALLVTIDTAAPQLTSFTVINPAMLPDETSDVYVTFSEPIVALNASAFTHVDGGSLGSFTTTDDGTTWLATFTPDSGSEDNVNTMTIDASQLRDYAGNVGSGTATSGNYATNAVAPPAPNAPVLMAASDSGVDNFDNLTNVTTPSFTVGAVANGATPAIYVDDVYQSGATTVDNGGGNWTVTLVTPLIEGTFGVSAKAVSGVGAHSAPSQDALSVTIDTTGPAIEIARPLPETFDFNSILVFHLGGDAHAGAGLLRFDDGAGDVHQYAVGGLNFDGDLLFDTDGVLLLGQTYTVTLDAGGAVDQAGNPSLQIQGTVTPIPVSPSDAPDLDSASDSGASDSDNLTNDTTPTFTGRADANVAIEVYDGGTLWGRGTSNNDGNYTVTADPLSEGGHEITVKAVDTFEHHSIVSPTQNITIDVTAPQVDSVSLNNTSMPAGQTCDVTVIFSEPIQAFSAASFSHVDAGSLGPFNTSDGGTTWVGTFTPDNGGPDTTNTMTVDATTVLDIAGNAGSGSGSSDNYATNITPPAAPSNLQVNVNSDTGSVDSDGITTDDTPQIDGTAQPNVDITVYDTDQTSILGTTTADISGIWHLDTNSLSAGSHTLYAQANSTTGVSGLSDPLEIVIDHTPPASFTLSSNSYGWQGVVTLFVNEAAYKPGGHDIVIKDVTVPATVLLLHFDTDVGVEGTSITFSIDSNVGNNNHEYSVTIEAGGIADEAGNPTTVDLVGSTTFHVTGGP